jgi:hypothetical protein
MMSNDIPTTVDDLLPVDLDGESEHDAEGNTTQESEFL